MSALSCGSSVTLPSLPVALLGKIVSFLPTNSDTMRFICWTSKSLRQNVSPILAALDGPKLSCLLTHLLNQVDEASWNSFFSLISPETSFSNISLDLTLSKPQLARLEKIQKRFSPIRSLIVEEKSLSIASVMAICPKLQKLSLREFASITRDEFQAVAFPDTLCAFSMRIMSLPDSVSSDMGSCIDQLFARCPHLRRFELEDAKESRNLRRSVHTVNWPSSLEHVRLAEWYFTQEELQGLLKRCPKLQSLSVRYLRAEVTAGVMQSLKFPASFEGVAISDAKEKARFLNKLRLGSVTLPFQVI